MVNEISVGNNVLKVFTNEEFGEIRTTMINGEYWFVGKDVALALGYGSGKSLNNAVNKHVFEEDKGVTEMMTPGGRQKIIVINESGMYALIFGSHLDTARKFKHWVTSEVLPTLRKTGQYQMQQNNPFLDLKDDFKITFAQINNIEDTVGRTLEVVNTVMDNMTLSTSQQGKLNKEAKDRVNFLLGGAGSEEYMQHSRSYFINLWNDLKEKYECASYKDLNPKYFDEAMDFIRQWEYFD